MIQGNVVTKNESDCGITVPGHNPDALDASGKRQPNVAGVYRNAIIGNTITDNGHLGEGAGVLFANASGGTASYDNLVQGNYIAGNQLAGVACTLICSTLRTQQLRRAKTSTATAS